jgi:hypothetical protein
MEGDSFFIGSASGGKELNEIAVINVLYVRIIAFHLNFDALGCPDTHTLGLQFRQGNAAGTECKIVDALFGHIFLLPKERAGALNGDAPGFFFHHDGSPQTYFTATCRKKKDAKLLKLMYLYGILAQ